MKDPSLGDHRGLSQGRVAERAVAGNENQAKPASPRGRKPKENAGVLNS